MRMHSAGFLVALTGLLVSGCVGQPQNSTATSVPKTEPDEEIVEFSHITFGVPGVNVADGISKEEACILAEFYRDEFLRGAEVVFESEDPACFFFRTYGEQRIVVAKSGDFVTRKGFQTLRYTGVGRWCWSADDRG
jgi:hypothetical protein